MANSKEVPPQNNDNSVAKANQGTFSPVEQERILVWRDKKEKEKAGFSYKIQNGKSNTRKKNINIEADFSNRNDLTQRQRAEIQRALYYAISGSTNDDYSGMFIGESAAALRGSTNKADFLANAFSGAMLGMEPKDIIESQLCAKLIILNSQAARFMSRAIDADDNRIIDLNINRSTKLMRLHNETLEALNRHRRKGEQRVTVQHVYINKGGQAVVAGEFTPGGGNKEKVKE